jgi:hypothetical protein
LTVSRNNLYCRNFFPFAGITFCCKTFIPAARIFLPVVKFPYGFRISMNLVTAKGISFLVFAALVFIPATGIFLPAVELPSSFRIKFWLKGTLFLPKEFPFCCRNYVVHLYHFLPIQKYDHYARIQSKISCEILKISCGTYPCSRGEKDSLCVHS